MNASASGPGSAWLPPTPPTVELSELEPWRPAGIDDLIEPPATRGDPRWNRLRHVVIDELDEDLVGLVISAWPRVDERHRLRFGDEDASKRRVTLADALLTVLAEGRLVPIDDDPLEEMMQGRELTVGDVFAAFLTSPREGGNDDEPPDGGGGPGIVAPTELFAPPVLDISTEAREVVKAQASAAASGVIDEAFLKLIDDEFREGEPPSHEPEPHTPRGSDSSGGAAAESSVSETVARTTESSESAAAAEELREDLRAEQDEASSETGQDRPMSMGA